MRQPGPMLIITLKHYGNTLVAGLTDMDGMDRLKDVQFCCSLPVCASTIAGMYLLPLVPFHAFLFLNSDLSGLTNMHTCCTLASYLIPHIDIPQHATAVTWKFTLSNLMQSKLE
eukprot:scpid32853/ scgid14964/ 